MLQSGQKCFVTLKVCPRLSLSTAPLEAPPLEALLLYCSLLCHAAGGAKSPTMIRYDVATPKHFTITALSLARLWAPLCSVVPRRSCYGTSQRIQHTNSVCKGSINHVQRGATAKATLAALEMSHLDVTHMSFTYPSHVILQQWKDQRILSYPAWHSWISSLLSVTNWHPAV